MKQPRRKKRGLGVLQVITCLLVASAVLRLATEVGPAMANEGTDAPFEEASQSADTGATDSLLSALQARERRLTEREAQLTARMEALRVAEGDIEQKLEALVEAEARLSATIALADTAAESDLAQLTTVYENMKPREAADLFAQMPPRFAAGFLGMMRPDAAALIMTELDPEIAYSFSVVLAGRNADVPTE
ncbi:MAG: MotE family protein [Yoonia sp.]